MKMKINKIIILIIMGSISILYILGLKPRIGYLSEFNLQIENTLKLNNIYYTNIIDENNYKESKYLLNNNREKFNSETIIKFINTNKNITKYEYSFRIKYYTKIFRNSNIYDVYIKTNNIIYNYNFIKIININNKSPYGSLISSKPIIEKNLYNIQYFLKIKMSLMIILFIVNVLIYYIKYIYFFSKIILFKTYCIIKKYINMYSKYLWWWGGVYYV